MKKTKMEKGITLIALIITIVVLLILAAVAINSIQNDGILHYATNAASSWNQAQKNEQTLLDGYLEYLDGGSKILDTNGNDIRNKKVTTNTTAYDKFGNKIVVPAGFMIRVDASTNNADTVIEGIVIEDATTDASGNATSTTGNQFVWIPVGNIKTSTTDTVGTTITLGRYAEFTKTSQPVQTIDNYTDCTEDVWTTRLYNDCCEWYTYDSIKPFLDSAIANDGYYIGRYETGDAEATGPRTEESSVTNKMGCRANLPGYNYATRDDLSSRCIEMAGSANTFKCEIFNSYSWDTAAIFVKKFSDDDPTQLNIMNMNDNSLAEVSTEMGYKDRPEAIVRGTTNSYWSISDYTDGSGTDSYMHQVEGFTTRPILYVL